MNAQFGFEWQSLKQRWQEAVKKADAWTSRFKNNKAYIRSVEPRIDALMVEWDQLEKQNEEMQEDIGVHKIAIDSRSMYLKNITKVARGKIRQTDLDAYLDRLAHRAYKSKFKGKPISPISKAAIEGILRAADMKESDMKAYFAEADRQDMAAIQQLQSCLHSNEERISTLEQEFTRLVRETLSRENERAKADIAEKDQCHQAMISWGAQDREHLAWILANDPSYSINAIKLYRKRFPDDDISSLLPQPEAKTLPTCVSRRPMRTRTSVADKIQTTTKNELRPWEFLFVTSEQEAGVKMPSEKTVFINNLKQLIDGPSMKGIDVSRVLSKLSLEAQRIDQKCLTLPRVAGPKFHNWFKGRVGSRYRMLMLPDRQARQIRFFLYAEKDQKLVLGQ